jgi:hypothetical protein
MATEFALDLVKWARDLTRHGCEKWTALVKAAAIYQSGDLALQGRSAQDVARKWIDEDVGGCRGWMR